MTNHWPDLAVHIVSMESPEKLEVAETALNGMVTYICALHCKASMASAPTTCPIVVVDSDSLFINVSGAGL